MKRLMFVVAMISFGVAGCGKSGSSDPVSKMKGFADRACNCKGDEKCLETVEKDFNAWEDEAKKGKRPSSEQMSEMQAEEARLEKCAEGQ